MTIDPEAKRALDLRLAKGEIDQHEYYKLLTTLNMSSTAAVQSAPPPQQAVTRPLEASPLLVFEDIAIFPTHIVVGGKRREFSDISQLEGGSHQLTMNGIPTVKHTALAIEFKDGTKYNKDEGRLIFGRKRHQALMQASHLLKQLTFRPCFDALVEDVRNNPVKIGIEKELPFESGLSLAAKLLSTWKPSPVYLQRDGSITNGNLVFDLKQCRREGKLELELRRANYSDPKAVYACGQRSLVAKSNRRALQFDLVGKHRPDVVMALLNWMAEPNNNL